MEQPATDFVIRPAEARDERAVLELVNADQVPGQPVATPAMLAEALAGRSGVDSGWWDELADLTAEVATTRTGRVVGVVSYATRPRHGAGIVLWLHGGEDRRVIDALLDHTLSRLGGRPVEAFSFATANARAADRWQHSQRSAAAPTSAARTATRAARSKIHLGGHLDPGRR